MPIQECPEVTELQEYLATIRRIRQQWPQDDEVNRLGDEHKLWFRGQGSWNWGLKPRLYRPPYKGADDDEIRLEFQSQAVQVLTGRLPNGETERWQWYFLMQHHRVPTRLLDWTESPLVALFFAVVGEPEPTDAAVWVLDPWWLNKKLKLGVSGPILPEYGESDSYLRDLEAAFSGKNIYRQLPAAIEPPHLDRRITAQSSRFLVFGTTQDLTKTKIVRRKDARLARLRVPAQRRRILRRELEECGVNYFSLFPDLEGLSAHIQWRWKDSSHIPSLK